MTEANMAPQAPAPDEAMQALLAKIAKIQKILGVLTCGQALMGLLVLVAPIIPSLVGSPELGFGLFMLAPFYFGLAYAANFAKKDLTFAKVAFRNTAISELGLFIASIYAYLSTGSLIVGIVAAAAIVFGGLAGIVIYQASKG
ncbi:MAG: hypothetical protein GXY34_13115 [Syntrophomonadaceae bacterium]|nr:hypothetical protein [Syntrophomonadaceae bacterium]